MPWNWKEEEAEDDVDELEDAADVAECVPEVVDYPLIAYSLLTKINGGLVEDVWILRLRLKIKRFTDFIELALIRVLTHIEPAIFGFKRIELYLDNIWMLMILI